MRTLRSSAILGVAVLLGAASTNLLILGSSTSTSAIAGGNGTDVRTFGSGGDYQGLDRISWAEDGDIPCYFKVHTRHLNTNNQTSDDGNLGGNSCNASSLSLVDAGFTSTTEYVYGVAVCRNNQRIKGIKLEYAKVDANGSVTDGVGVASQSRVNCSYYGWSPMRYCPTNKIATQVKVYFKPDNPVGLGNNIKQAATGLQLVCRNVQVKP